MILSWTAPPDDFSAPGVGRVSSYDLRYFELPITDDAVFALATPVLGLSPPQAAGQPEQATVSGLISNTIYFFAIKSTDAAGNISAL